MVFSSVVLGLTSDEYFVFSNLINNGLFYFSLCLFLLLSPLLILSYKKKTTNVIYVPSDKLLVPMNFVFIILSFISVIYFSTIIYQLLTSQDLEVFRHILVSKGHPLIKPSVINTLSGVVATFYTFTLFLFFINVIKGGSKWVSICLLVGSLSYPFFVFSYFGRDGFIFWIFSFLSLYLMFGENIPPEVKLKVKGVLRYITVLFAGTFIFMSFVRFGNFEMVLIAILSYLGQQPYVFAETFNINLTPRLGLTSFHLFANFYLDPSHTDVYLKELGGNISLSWKFATMVNNFYLDFGSIGCLVFLIALSALIIVFFNDKKNNFFKLFLFYAYLQILIQGVFYFRQYNDVGNLYLACLVFIAFAYRFIPCSIMIRKN